MSIDDDLSDMPELEEVETPPQSPLNVTNPPPIIRPNQSLNSQQFRELFNSIQPITRRASIISQTNLLAQLFDTSEFNPSHPDD